jgi:hypothetical protein
MPKTVHQEILDWSVEQPKWQRDALRRLFGAGLLVQQDHMELLAICKQEHGLATNAPNSPLSAQHVVIGGLSTDEVSMLSVTHHQGVNNLAPEQTVSFGAHLTVVYGQNASGKSGYTRILKRACRSRGVEDILGDVLSGQAPTKAKASIQYRIGPVDKTCTWTPDGSAVPELGAISVFDAHCVPVYLKDKTDVAFRPFGLDIFDKLAACCQVLKGLLDAEFNTLNGSVPTLPTVHAGTRARALIDGLTALTESSDVKALATLSAAEEQNLADLQAKRRDLQAANPKELAKDLNLKADRIQLVADHILQLGTALGVTRFEALRGAARAVSVAQAAVTSLRQTALSADTLPGTGGQPWREMWDSTAVFSEVAHPAQPFPFLGVGAKCPFCQQEIGNEAKERLTHFAEYVTSTAQSELRKAELELAAAWKSVAVVVDRKDVANALEELKSDSPDLHNRVVEFISKAKAIETEVQKRANPDVIQGLAPGPTTDVAARVETYRQRAKELSKQTHELNAADAKTLLELEARAGLRAQEAAILGEVQRKRKLAAYRQCIDDTSTLPVTRKSTELTKRLVTDLLRSTFKDELKKLDFTHLLVEVQVAGGAKGALFHKIAFSNAPGVVVTNVLSEGEARTLSLAAFLTELGTAPNQSAIIFDDPVSSLDHMWRERIAKRLVLESKTRQVVVFTHDLLFLRQLIDESKQQSIDCKHQYVRRDGQAGICLPDLPWVAMPVKDRIGRLRARLQTADKTYRTQGQDAYETDARDIYGLLREAWEQAISEVLLNGVVERYRPSIETKRVEKLFDITVQDTKTVEAAMTETSRWIRGHDQAAAEAVPVPGPDEVKKRIQALDDWVQSIRTRRK